MHIVLLILSVLLAAGAQTGHVLYAASRSSGRRIPFSWTWTHIDYMPWAADMAAAAVLVVSIALLVWQIPESSAGSIPIFLLFVAALFVPSEPLRYRHNRMADAKSNDHRG